MKNYHKSRSGLTLELGYGNQGGADGWQRRLGYSPRGLDPGMGQLWSERKRDLVAWL